MNEIAPNLWLGDMQDAQSAFSSNPGMTIICVLESNPFPQARNGYLWAPFLSKPTAKERQWALTKLAANIHELRGQGTPVLVHCGAGIERSPLAVAWYLVFAKLQPDLDAAYAYIRQKRPQVQDRRSWVQ